ncbi:hypothetical protein ASD44_04520 [Mesorhizobium sp. Root554]|uniref:DUF2865 domain-containing protein n=1 Tax=unclassified Mesorhizobium TaxID=325217 RepID=UPI0007018E85|nr:MULTISPECIES: DUF2865 domain-containing protein [unclassified Mesorhizobium]KQZ13421.1 hypothetical protein ASD27_04525 [Mesorhizobium sp. Root1471]KQZ35933.1 hypothetical protein ASD44_04520 [Mesorhizobium sp. Root554]
MKGKGWRLILVAVLFGMAASSAAVEAEAASRICRQLQAELASLPRGGGSARQIGRYDDAIDRQRDQIAKARDRARSAGCNFFLFGGSVAQCASLNATLDRMNGNLDALQRKREQLAGGGGGRAERYRILSRLDAHGCNRPGVVERTEARAATRESLQETPEDQLRQIEQIAPEDEPRQSAHLIISPPGFSGSPDGEYRTMCVRTCDGYFYPMSNAASLGDFERDQKNCESSCPGTEMQVFYQRGLAEDSAKMTSSANGRPYSELPTAYLYKKPGVARPVSCGCNAAGTFSIIGGGSVTAGQPVSESSSVMTMPAIAPAPSKATRASAVEEPGVTPAISHTPDPDRKVRVVGPTFLPVPQAATDPQAPAPTPVQ